MNDDKPIHLMSPSERFTEAMERTLLLCRHFQSQNVDVGIDGMTLSINTSQNTYFIDIADYDPRLITMQTIYDVEPGDPIKASLVAASATEKSYAAKAIVRPNGKGYRLHFVSEMIFDDLPAFTSIIGMVQGAIESCREKFISIGANS